MIGVTVLVEILNDKTLTETCYEHVILCLRNIAVHSEYKILLMKLGVIPTLVQFLSYDDNEKIQEHSAGALGNLAAYSKNKKIIAEENGKGQKKNTMI